MKIPNFIGKTADEIDGDGFDIEIYPIYTDKESGIVLSQEPSEDSLRKIARGEKIKLRLGVSAPEKCGSTNSIVGSGSICSFISAISFNFREK